LYLKFVSNLSNAEVGDILERTEGAIKSLYHRTLLALRDDIEMQHTRVGAPGRAPAANAEIKRTEGN
jgi:DNA-directed RNA polymerase specialized sigma24 family protein